jgi:hypothetical protein
MDGSNPIIIYQLPCKTKNRIDQMTLDRINKKILVSSPVRKKIYTIDYNGKVSNTVLHPQSGVLSMSTTRNELFWVNAVYCEYQNT